MEQKQLPAGGDAIIPAAVVGGPQSFLPVAAAKARRDQLLEFIDSCMVEGEDYGYIPGTEPKPGEKKKSRKALLKPGAEKLCNLFGLEVRISAKEEILDWTGADHGGEPFFYSLYRYSLYRDGRCHGEGEGSCNSWERKYRYRNGERKCPACGAAAIIKGKSEYGGGWICFDRKGGCKAKFSDNEPSIVGQQTGQVSNPDVADIVNTIQKMAQKRGLVCVVLIATGTSDIFTQDMEPALPEEDHHRKSEPPAKTQNPTTAKKAAERGERVGAMQTSFRALEATLGAANVHRLVKLAGYDTLESITDLEDGTNLYKNLRLFENGVVECRAMVAKLPKDVSGKIAYAYGLIDPAEAEDMKDLRQLHAALKSAVEKQGVAA